MKKIYSNAAIQERITDISASLNKEFKENNTVHVIVIMNGGIMFAADLVRKLNLPVVMHFTGGSYFKGHIKQDLGLNAETLPASFANSPVIIIEDILDAGQSVKTIRQLLADRQASSISVVTLLKRQGFRGQVSHAAFTIPDNMFVVGYGMDLDGRHRELKDVYHLASSPVGATGGVC